MRVYYDRLVDLSDKAWFFEYLTQTVDQHLGAQFNTLFAALDSDQDGKVYIINFEESAFLKCLLRYRISHLVVHVL